MLDAAAAFDSLSIVEDSSATQPLVLKRPDGRDCKELP